MAASIPQFRDLMWPTLLALRDLGGSAHNDEIMKAVIERLGFTEEQQEVRRRPGDQVTLIEHRLAWARNYLKNIGAIENSARGVWSITDEGRSITDEEAQARVKVWKAEYSKAYAARKENAPDPEIDEALEPDDAPHWRDELLARLLSLSPDAFERLAQRLLREAGFRNVEVLGKSGDGGLDGVGVYRLSLVSFPVFFQCKRYKGSVRAHAVRDFRGAMSGRGEKGLLITTGTFTKEAREEATRDGAPPVELVDGDDLCDLLRQYELGVRTTQRVVEDVNVEGEFFDQL